MLDLLATDQAVNEGFHESFQPRQHAVEDLRGHFAFVQQLLPANIKIQRIHAKTPSVELHPTTRYGRPYNTNTYVESMEIKQSK